jgi:putative oxidoreductase
MNAIQARYQQLAQLARKWLSTDLIALISRIAIAATFWLSGRTKVEGWLTVKDATYDLFRDEYKLPVIPPEFAAHMATYAEHALPILMLLGLAARLSALGLIGMTLVIQFLVYPDAWPTHLTWGAALLFLIANGPGKWSMDRAIRLD